MPNADGWSEFTFKTEVVYKAPYRFRRDSPDRLPDPYVQYVVGVDRLIPNLFSQQDQLTLTLEYLGEEDADDFTADFRPFQSDVVARAFWEAGDFRRTSLEFRAVVDTERGETILEAIYEQQLRSFHDDLKLQVGIQYFDPDRQKGLFSFFPNNTNVRVELRFDF